MQATLVPDSQPRRQHPDVADVAKVMPQASRNGQLRRREERVGVRRGWGAWSNGPRTRSHSTLQASILAREARGERVGGWGGWRGGEKGGHGGRGRGGGEGREGILAKCFTWVHTLDPNHPRLLVRE